MFSVQSDRYVDVSAMSTKKERRVEKLIKRLFAMFKITFKISKIF